MQFADIFIKAIDFAKGSIVFDVRNKEDGKLLQPAKVVPFVINDGSLHFEMKHIPIELAKHIVEILK